MQFQQAFSSAMKILRYNWLRSHLERESYSDVNLQSHMDIIFYMFNLQ